MQRVINGLTARLASEIARCEMQVARADTLADELADARAQLDDAREIIAELSAQLARTIHQQEPDIDGDGDDGEPG